MDINDLPQVVGELHGWRRGLAASLLGLALYLVAGIIIAVVLSFFLPLSTYNAGY